MLGKEVRRQTIHLTNKTPITGITAKAENSDQYFAGRQAFTDKETMAFTGRATLTGNTNQLSLFFVGNGRNPIKLAHQVVKLTS